MLGLHLGQDVEILVPTRKLWPDKRPDTSLFPRKRRTKWLRGASHGTPVKMGVHSDHCSVTQGNPWALSCLISTR
jgi:hypothetical protein